MEPQTAILVGASLATCGWLYTARRARTLARKQHTINVILQANFNSNLREAKAVIADAIKTGPCPDLRSPDHKELRDCFRLVANHYEFISAGLRNGDFDERLIRDIERAQILSLFEFAIDFIWQLRDARRRLTIYEHLEWLHGRWEKCPPEWHQRCLERALDRPLAGSRINPHPKG